MKLIRGLSGLKNVCQGCVLTIGSFDGLHTGHRALVSQVIDKSREYGIQSVVVSFFPHPSKVLRPTQASPRLFSIEDLGEQLEAMNVDILVIEPFNLEFSQLSAEEFLAQRLMPVLHPREIVVGHDFAFGKERAGSYPALLELGIKYNFKVSRLEPVMNCGERVSSSLVRQYLAHGEILRVTELLTRPFYISGNIVAGEGRGEGLGFATANLSTESETLPMNGVYLTHFCLDGVKHPSLTNIGHKPTFHQSAELSIETHVLGVKEKFYGKTVQLEFLDRIRSELKFSSAHALIVQIEDDVRHAKEYFGL